MNTPKDALKWCSGAKSFKDFKGRVLRCNIDTSIVSSVVDGIKAGFDTNMIDWR